MGYPDGTERWAAGTVPTDYRFTGQRFNGTIQLTLMGARWQDGRLGAWMSADSMVPDRSNPPSLNRFSYAYGRPLVLKDPSGHCPVGIPYSACRWGVDALSSIGYLHGRRDVQEHQATIAAFAGHGRSLDANLVAASIAHQASDWKERPWGWECVDRIEGWYIEHIRGKTPSRGIAQLRTKEVANYVYKGADPYDPLVAIRGMYGKLSAANEAILGRDGNISTTDRYMLLAIAQNSQSGDPIGVFFRGNRNWAAITGHEDKGTDWTDLLELVYLQYEWASEQDWWQAPEDLNLDEWRKVAFGEEH